MSVVDAAQRAEVLDTRRSFCVTAPAGSGKTELLIQRLLALLPNVERPEQVLAITFTRKAAAEMRERILLALQAAAAETPCEAPHEQTTRRLALAALAASERQGWRLLDDLSRLNIKTIDSYCAGLTRQMPVLSGFGGQAQPVDQAQELYQEAVRRLLGFLGSEREEAEDLAELLLHFDNNAARLETLLVAMLARRDQWQDYMGTHHKPSDSERALRASVESLVEEELADITALLQPFDDQLFDLLCYSLGHLDEELPPAFPSVAAQDTEHWRALAGMLLTNSGQWRRTINVKQGFPAGKGEAAERKAHLMELIVQMSEIDGLEARLAGVAMLPDMSANSTSWQIVLRLSHVLPLLSALLLVVFRERGQVDHSQVAQGALQALGDEDSPTDLALRLDYQLEHILVDEFQDTAINQYKLLLALTRNWLEHNALNPDRPRTLFLVGDGMQSIYGFRDANVALFLRARSEGFNGLTLEPLSLECNFRSRAGIVRWVNETFRAAFPATDNVQLGEVAYTEAAAVQAEGDAPAVAAHAFVGDEAAAQEAEFVAATIADILDADEDEGVTLAILGRTRSALVPVLRALQSRGVAYAAQDMDPLSGSPVIVDLLSLCRAVANPADRTAWYALWRSPLCGLKLADLHAIARWQAQQAELSPWLTLTDPELLALLPADASQRMRHLGACMKHAWSKRDRLNLRVWVEQLWLSLGGPAALTDELQFRDAEHFFELLQQAEQEGEGLSIDWLQPRLEQLFAAGDSPLARVQVMTLHKAKGLEFDQVFIPGLARGSRSNARELLLWEQYNGRAGQQGFLLAAEDHGEPSEPTLYNYLRARGERRNRAETTRLLYVGATRAVQRLHLSACLTLDVNEDWQPGEPFDVKAPQEGTLLSPIWDSFSEQMLLHEPLIDPAGDGEAPLRSLLRPTVAPSLPDSPAVPPGEDPNIPEPSFNRVERYTGTVVHLALELLAEGHLSAEDCLATTGRDRWRLELRDLGLAGDELAGAERSVMASLERTLDDKQWSSWLLNPTHPESASEWPVTWRDESGTIRDLVIDRTFVDPASDERWIVDYKTSAPLEGESEEAFVTRELAHYREQLQNYGKAVAALDERSIQCALYFTRLGRLAPLNRSD